MSKSPLFYWLILTFSIILANTSSGDSDKPSKIDPIFFTIAEKNISKLDFEILFTNWLQEYYPSQEPTNTNYDKFLDAVVNYKLLTQKADDFYKGKNQNLISEFEIYFQENIDSTNFLRQVEEQVIREAFVRSHYMIDADQILLAFENSDNKKAKTANYHEASKLKIRLSNNETSFEQSVSSYSDDKQSKDNAGRIGLFTVFEQIYPVESAAYDLEINSISKPIKSRFGYHLIRTRGKIELQGLKNTSHILVKSNIDDAQAKRKIFEIYSRITNKNFQELARQHSQDYKTASKGGELGTNRLIYDLELKKQTLTKGKISKPFRSKIGWHIMTVSELIEFKPYWQQRSNLKQMIQFDSRVQRVIESIKSDSPYQPIQKLRQAHWQYFMVLNYLRAIDPDLNVDSSTELELIKIIADSKLSIDFSKLKKKYPVEIAKEVLQGLFN